MFPIIFVFKHVLKIRPEVVLGKPYDELCDVFSFSMIMWEVLVGKLDPFNQTLYIEVKMANSPDLRPTIPEEFMQDVQKYGWYIELMKQCWQQEPSNRPAFAHICEVIEQHIET